MTRDRRENFGVRWTPADRAIIRAEYGRTPTPALAARLNRTVMAIQTQASALGVAVHPHWSAEEKARLRNFWDAFEHDARLYRRLAEALGRDPSAVHSMARHLGLPFGVPQGYIAITEAARTAGLTVPAMWRLLVDAGAKVYRLPRDPGSKHVRGSKSSVRRFVDPLVAEDVVAAWTRETETVASAARRHGHGEEWLYRRLRVLGHLEGVAIRPSVPTRLPTRVLDEAAMLLHAREIAARFGLREALVQAVFRDAGARRDEVVFLATLTEAQAWLVAAGVIDERGVATGKRRHRIARVAGRADGTGAACAIEGVTCNGAAVRRCRRGRPARVPARAWKAAA